MGILYDFINSIDKMTIATEADDITGDISSKTDDIMGNNNDGSTQSSDPNEIDTNTDDILGTKSDDSGDNNDDDLTGDDSESPDNMSEDDPTADGDESGDMNNQTGDYGDDPSNNLDNPDENKDDPFTDSRKRKIKKQFMHLYNVIDNSIKLLSSYTPSIIDSEYINISSNIKDNLSQCKDIIYDLAVKDFQTAEYHELLKKYVAINRIYELSIKSIEKYFDEKGKNNGK